MNEQEGAIGNRKGVIAAEQYFGRINADTFSSFVHEHFTSMFKKCPKPKGNFFLENWDPYKIVVKPDLLGMK